MTEAPNYEPFLLNKCIIFDGMFTIIDPAYSTSEIKPIMLSVPKQYKNMHQGLAKVSQPPVKLPAESKPKSRLLSSSIRKTVQPTSSNEQPPTQPEPPKQQSPRNSARQSAPKDAPKQPSPRAQIKVNPELEKFVESDKEFWGQPLPSKILAEFLIDMNKSKTVMKFTMILKSPVLEAVMNGLKASDELSIRGSDRYSIGSFYDSDKNALVGLMTDKNSGKTTEICAAKYNDDGSFDLLIPALKKDKNTGKGYMFPIEFPGKNSAIVSKFESKLKEVIRLTSRTKSMDKVDYTFNGKFPSPDKANFVIYHESNANKDICACGKAAGTNSFNLTVSYPMNTIQALFAVVASNVSH